MLTLSASSGVGNTRHSLRGYPEGISPREEGRADDGIYRVIREEKRRAGRNGGTRNWAVLRSRQHPRPPPHLTRDVRCRSDRGLFDKFRSSNISSKTRKRGHPKVIQSSEHWVLSVMLSTSEHLASISSAPDQCEAGTWSVTICFHQHPTSSRCPVCSVLCQHQVSTSRLSTQLALSQHPISTQTDPSQHHSAQHLVSTHPALKKRNAAEHQLSTHPAPSQHPAVSPTQSVHLPSAPAHSQ